MGAPLLVLLRPQAVERVLQAGAAADLPVVAEGVLLVEGPQLEEEEEEPRERLLQLQRLRVRRLRLVLRRPRVRRPRPFLLLRCLRCLREVLALRPLPYLGVGDEGQRGWPPLERRVARVEC